jgi:hypothetical protein
MATVKSLQDVRNRATAVETAEHESHRAPVDGGLHTTMLQVSQTQSDGLSSRVLFKLEHEFEYCAYYCEENIWRALHKLQATDAELRDLHCVFMSNDNETVPFWSMRNATNGGDRPLVYDYHVVGIGVSSGVAYVIDLDNAHGSLTTFDEYCRAVLQTTRALPPMFRRMYRVVTAEELFATFSSNRSHMLNDDGTHKAPPPNWACIQVADQPDNNLFDKFVNMHSTEIGRVFDQQQAFETFVQALCRERNRD